ncbi:hypothetical protein [Tropicimonas sp. S265A]|uniref:hypothetical protein n=1 Tax=Tropicimonas sp. S265A TaxID=3415134 RepID=UPI003C7E59AB
MSEVSELEERLVTAMARIRAAVHAKDGDAAASAPDQAQLDVLEAERDAARLAAETAAEAQAGAEARLAELDAEMTQLRETVQNLQTVNAELRVAASEGVQDPDVINKALAADLAALQAARAADLRDIEAILAQIGPVEEGASHA